MSARALAWRRAAGRAYAVGADHAYLVVRNQARKGWTLSIYPATVAVGVKIIDDTRMPVVTLDPHDTRALAEAVAEQYEALADHRGPTNRHTAAIDRAYAAEEARA